MSGSDGFLKSRKCDGEHEYQDLQWVTLMGDEGSLVYVIGYSTQMIVRG